METFIIIDCRGARHATIKAKSRKEAMEKYASDIPNGIVMAINTEDLEVFKTNINNL